MSHRVSEGARMALLIVCTLAWPHRCSAWLLAGAVHLALLAPLGPRQPW
jgi:hypothetical protein